MKVWITKYALTDGIQVVVAECTESFPSMIRYGDGQYAHGEGKDWHRTPESAELRAEVMRKAKIASLKKSLRKMEGMTVKAPRLV